MSNWGAVFEIEASGITVRFVHPMKRLEMSPDAAVDLATALLLAAESSRFKAQRERDAAAIEALDPQRMTVANWPATPEAE